MQENVMALAGTDGVELGFITHWVYLSRLIGHINIQMKLME